MIIFLALVLIILMILIGGERGAVSLTLQMIFQLVIN